MKTLWAQVFALSLLVIAIVAAWIAFRVKVERERDTGRRVSVANSLHALAYGLLAEEQAVGRPPLSAIFDSEGQPLLSWRVRILPYIDENELFAQFHLDEPWDSENNLPLVDKMPDFYRGPLHRDLKGKTTFLVPVGPATMFDGDGTTVFEIADGPHETIFVLDADLEHAVPWTKPEDLEIDMRNPIAGLQWYPSDNEPGGVFIFARADGSAGPLPANLDPAKLWGFFTPAGGDNGQWPDEFRQR